MIDHQKNNYCIYDTSNVNEMCDEFIINKNSIHIFNVCEACIIAYYNDNKDKIDNEISNNNPHVCSFVGYIEYINKNYDLARQYFLIGEKDNIIAIIGMSYYYKNIKKNDILYEKYFMMAVNHGYIGLLYDRAHFYQYVDKNYDMAIKYYLIGINKTCEIKIPFLRGLCTILNPIKIYYLVDNKDVILQNIEEHHKMIIKQFIEKSSRQLCQSCYLENDCCLKNDVYLCGLCS